MSNSNDMILEGGCTCGEVRYCMTSSPMFVHCCHCTWCQRESGTSFALNAMIETDRVKVLQGTPEMIDTPSNSGKGQQYARCPKCHIALWSHYSSAKEAISFVRVGSLDNAAQLPPDIHIFTSTKQPWVKLGSDIPVVEYYYDRNDYWPQDSLDRLDIVFANKK